jgi:hypothetical protein
MAVFEDLAKWAEASSALPPVTAALTISLGHDDANPVLVAQDLEPQPISSFVCIVDYGEGTRLITCRRIDRIGELHYVGAICHTARGYRQFRCDRITSVYDASTGELIGNGSYFEQFALDASRERSQTWGLIPSRKAMLVAGLNILAFMARCDGIWHPLEEEIIESFICTMWLRNEWEGDPPVNEILAHAQRLAPDGETFFRSLRQYATSSKSAKIISRAVGDLIAADGVICSTEASWGAEIDAFFSEYREDAFQRHFGAEREVRTA